MGGQALGGAPAPAAAQGSSSRMSPPGFRSGSPCSSFKGRRGSCKVAAVPAPVDPATQEQNSALQGISPTRNPISNPALSLDRLRLERGMTLDTCISPADKAGFLRAVAARAPQLRLEGDRLVLKAPPEES